MSDFFFNKRVFVSGGAGVIGQELVLKLHQKGARLFVGDLKARPEQFPMSIQYRQGDLRSITKAELARFAPEVVFHLAASFERSTEEESFWEENYQNNLFLSHHLANCLKDLDSLSHIVFASSYLLYDSKIYLFSQPQGSSISLSETSPIFPRNLTGSAKLHHEVELGFLAGFRPTLKVVLARIFRGYGKGSRDVLSRWVRSLLQGRPIEVYQPENRFDYIYAADSAEGLIRLAESQTDGVVNVASGASSSVSDVLECLKNHFPNMEVMKRSAVGLYEASEANIQRLVDRTGWRPEYTLQTGIAEIVEYEKKQPTVCPKFCGTVLVTSLSAKVPLLKAIRKAFCSLGWPAQLIGGDINPNCVGRYFVDEWYNMPVLNTENMPLVLKWCFQHNVKAIIPTRDGELLFWAKHAPQFIQHGITVHVSTLESITTTLDKWKFFRVCADFGFPVVPTAKNVDDLTCARYVVKERYGAGSRKIGLNLSKEEALSWSKTLTSPLFQPYLAGQEYSVDLYVTKAKKVHGVVVRERNLVVDGESQITTTVDHPKLAELCSTVAVQLGLWGHQVFQAIQDENGTLHLLECNSRFGGASTLAMAAGLDSLDWFFLEAQGLSLKDHPFVAHPPGLMQVRYKEDKVIHTS